MISLMNINDEMKETEKNSSANGLGLKKNVLASALRSSGVKVKIKLDRNAKYVFPMRSTTKR